MFCCIMFAENMYPIYVSVNKLYTPHTHIYSFRNGGGVVWSVNETIVSECFSFFGHCFPSPIWRGIWGEGERERLGAQIWWNANGWWIMSPSKSLHRQYHRAWHCTGLTAVTTPREDLALPSDTSLIHLCPCPCPFYAAPYTVYDSICDSDLVC